jgi:hypothetical protein
MARIAGPASRHTNWFVSGIHDAVSNFACDVVQTAGRHIFSPGMTRAIHEKKFAAASDGAIEFGTIANHVPVPARHEILIPDSTGLDFGKAPVQASLRARWDRFPPPDSIRYCFRIKLLPGLMVAEDSDQLTEFLFRSLETGGLQTAVGPVHEGMDGVHNGNRLNRTPLECKQKEQSFDHYPHKANNIAVVKHLEVILLI